MATPAKLRVLLLAGRRQDEKDAIARAAGVSCKAFAPVAGRPMIERVLRVLVDHPHVGDIDVALPQSVSPAEVPALDAWLKQGRIHRVPCASSPAATIDDALAGSPAGRPVLVTTADHALLNAAMVDRFLAGCDTPGIDAWAGLLPLDLLEARYPAMRRTGLKLRDGSYSGCNLFLIRTGPGARSLLNFWLKLEGLRKSPWRMALAVGPLALLGYGMRRMTLAGALDTIGKRTGARLAPVMLDIPEAAVDVDTLDDLAFVEALLG